MTDKIGYVENRSNRKLTFHYMGRDYTLPSGRTLIEDLEVPPGVEKRNVVLHACKVYGRVRERPGEPSKAIVREVWEGGTEPEERDLSAKPPLPPPRTLPYLENRTDEDIVTHFGGHNYRIPVGLTALSDIESPEDVQADLDGLLRHVDKFYASIRGEDGTPLPRPVVVRWL